MKFYFQQFSLTAAILGLWFAVVFLCTYNPTPPIKKTVENTQPTGREVVEARDESTGEVVRVHRFNADNERTEMEITFKDKTRGVVTFNGLQQPSRAVEYYPNGSRQVFTFGMRGLSKRESFRADNTRSSESVPGNDGSVITRRFDADGRTVTTIEQKFKDGSHETVLLHKDGKTPHIRFRQGQDPMKMVLSTYTAKGVLKTVEHIERIPDECDSPDCPNAGGEISMTRYRDDGKTPLYKGTWYMQGGSSNCTSYEEYHDDGKTVKTRVKFNFEPTAEEKAKGDDAGVSKVVEKFDGKGKLQSLRLLRDDDSVSRDESFAPEGTHRQYFKKGAGVKEPLKFDEPTNFIELQQQLVPQEEPNHLKQMMSP